MADDVTLKFRLTGEDASASSALDKVAAKTDHTAEKVSGIGKAGVAVGTALGGLASMGVSALGSLAVSAISTGLSTASAMEQANIGFTTLLGSAQKSKAFVAELSTFAANTPFEFPGLVDSSRTLLGVGVAAKDVVPMLTDFGDAAGALSIDQEHFQGIMMATSQAISAGKFQAGDLNQIMNNGLPVWSLLAKAMNKTVPELRDMSSHGKLLASDVLPALQREMHKDYGGAMQKQSQTLSGQWSTMQDTFSQGMAQVLQPLMPMLKEALPGAMKVLGDGLKATADGVSTMVGWFKQGGTASNTMSTAFDGLKKIVSAVSDWFKNELMPVLRDAAEQIMPKIRSAIQSVTQTMREHHDIIVYVQGVFKVLGLFITEILVPVLSNLVQLLLTILGPAFRVVADIISGIVIPMVKFLVSVILGIVGTIINAAATAFGWIPGLGPKLKGAADGFNKFKNDVNNALAGITSHKVVSVDVLVNGQKGTVKDVGGGVYNISVGGTTVRALAGGGIVRRPTLAMVGESGPEAVVPLSGAGGGAAAGIGGGGTIIVNVTNAVIGNEDAISRVITAAVRRAQGRGYGTAFA